MLSLGAHDGRPDMTQHGIEAVLAHLAKLPPPGSLTLAEQRAQYERAERAFPIPPEVAVRHVTAPVAPAEWLVPPSARDDVVLLYLHGGGYVIGSPRSHRHPAAAPIVRPALVSEMARAYLAGADPRTPLASPLYADLRGLPPLLIHVGSDEVLLDDAAGLAERARAAGVDAALEIAPRMIHVWHWFLPMLPEAQTAVDAIGAFIDARVG